MIRHCFSVLLGVLSLGGLLAWAGAQAVPLTPPATYQLQTGDSVGVVYRLTPEYNQTVSVQPDGTVTLQLLGAVRVRGLTVDEARVVIHDAAAKRLRDPEVSLEIRDWEKPHFTVLGEVGLPGRFELRGPLSVEDALAMAGGVKGSGKRTNILLIHRVDATVGQTQLVDLRMLERNPKPGTELLALQPGDIVVVPISKLTKVERYVRLINFGIGSYIPL